MSIGTWHKPADMMPAIGQSVIAAYPDDRHVVLIAWMQRGDWCWTYADGSHAPDPEFWLEERDAN